MMTRRDALKAAAALGAASVPTLAVTPEQAAALLDAPATFDPGRGRTIAAEDADFGDPIRFAEALDGLDFRDLFEHGAAVQMAEYKQAVNALIDRYPELREQEGEPPESRLLTRLDEAAITMWTLSWMAGVRAGAAYEHLRLAMVTPRRLCPACHGEGRLWGGKPFRRYDDGTNETHCERCGGQGTEVTPPARIA